MNDVKRATDLLKSPKDLCLSADGSKLFILDLFGVKHHRILVLNAYDGTYLQTIGMNQIDSSPNSICVSHDGRELFVAQMYGKKSKCLIQRTEHTCVP